MDVRPPYFNSKEYFNDRFHTTIMEYSISLCKRVVDTSTQVFRAVLLENKLPYDLFQLQKFYITFYSLTIESYKNSFLYPMFAAIEENQIDSRNKLTEIFFDKIAKQEGIEEFTNKVADTLTKFLLNYCEQEFNFVLEKRAVKSHLEYFKKSVTSEIDIYNMVIFKFLEGNFDEFAEYLQQMYAKRIKVFDVFGRYMFSPLEENTPIVNFSLETKHEKVFFREFCGPFLTVIERYLLGATKYQSVNKYFLSNIQKLFGRNVKLTKHNFEKFYRYEKFKRYLCGYLIYVMDKMDTDEKRETIVRLVNDELKNRTDANLHFETRHFRMLLDSWLAFIKTYNPELLKKSDVAALSA